MNALYAEIDRLKRVNGELVEVCKAMIRISDLWIPANVDYQHKGEAQALHLAREKMIAAIQKAETP
jgi:hypothetical protein